MEVSAKLTRVLSLKKRQREDSVSQKLDKQLSNSCLRFFHKKVEFHTVSGLDSHLDNLRGKYKPLNSCMAVTETPLSPTGDGGGDCSKNPEKTSPSHSDDIPKPVKEIFDSNDLEMDWKCTRGIGAGLTNMGNTCFLNSVLQCLVYTAPLHNYMASLKHKQSCK